MDRGVCGVKAAESFFKGSGLLLLSSMFLWAAVSIIVDAVDNDCTDADITTEQLDDIAADVRWLVAKESGADE